MRTQAERLLDEARTADFDGQAEDRDNALTDAVGHGFVDWAIEAWHIDDDRTRER